MNRPYRPRLAALLLAQMLLVPAYAGTTWDGDATPDTSINNPLNWDADTLPALNGPTTFSVLTFPTASGTATIDVPVEIARAVLSNSFTLASGAGSLTIRATNSGGNAYGIQATSGAALAVIDEPVLVRATPNAAPYGNLFLVYNNRQTPDTTTLRINGGIALAPSSTATAYTLRYGNVGGTSDTRIAGPITGMGLLQNSSANGAWAGDLIIAGDQAGVTTTDITLGGAGFLAPAATARLVLGETSDDEQTWRNLGLVNVMNLAVGGNITVNALSTSVTVATKITGIAADLPSAGTLRIASGTVNTVCVIGGTGTNENNLNLVKYGSGTLTVNGTHSHLGTTTVEAGVLNLNGTVASPLVIQSTAVLNLASTAAANGGVTINSGASLGGEGTIGGTLTFVPGLSYLTADLATPAALTATAVSGSGASVIVAPTTTGVIGTPYLILSSPAGLASVTFVAGSSGSLTLQNGDTELWFTPAAAVPVNLTWTGTDASNPSTWNVATIANWTDGSTAKAFFGGDNVTFDDTATTIDIVTQGSVSPGTLTFNNVTKNFGLTGGSIGGSGPLLQNGTGTTTIANVLSLTGGVAANAGTLVLTGTNTFTGGLDVSGGTVSFTTFAALGSTATAIDLNSGGTLRYAGTATVTNDVINYTVGTGGGAISIDTNNNVTVRLGGKISGDGAITKSGPGILSLGRSSDVDPGNDFTGPFTVSAGILDIRALNSLGATSAGTTVQDATLLIQNFAQSVGTKTFAAEPLTFSGNAFVTAYCQEGKLFTNQLAGPVTVAEGAVLGLSTARNSSGAISPTLELTGTGVTTGAGSTLSFGLRTPTYPAGLNEDYQTVTITGPITGPANVVTQGSAISLYTLNAPAYSGNTSALGGFLKLTAANPNNEASTVTIAETNTKLELDFAGTDTVARLFIGTTQQPAGTYGATGSGATTIDDARFLGTGTLTVTAGPIVATPFETWAAGFGLTGNDALVASDPDGDGLSNILEYATGSSPIASGPANVTLDRSGDFLSLTFNRVADASITYTVEGTDDLTNPASWIAVDDVLSVNPATGTAADPVTVIDTVSVSGAGKRFLRLRINY